MSADPHPQKHRPHQIPEEHEDSEVNEVLGQVREPHQISRHPLSQGLPAVERAVEVDMTSQDTTDQPGHAVRININLRSVSQEDATGGDPQTSCAGDGEALLSTTGADLQERF